MARAVEDPFAGPTLFRDRSKLDYDWVPERLVHRDAERGRLAQIFRGVSDGATGEKALITGRVGTGKTALAKWFARDLQEAERARGHHVETVWVNCRKNAAEGLILLKLLQHFDKNYPTRGYGTHEMLGDLRKHIDRRNCHVVVLLDEIDALVRKETELVYALSRFDDERPIPKATLSLLLVSARPESDIYAMLDEATRSTVKRTNVVTLAPYTASQLRDILADRVALAFHKGVVVDDVIELAADIAAPEGDARYAIELLVGAGRAAEEARATTVEAEHVRAVKAHTRSGVSEAKLRLLAPHPLYVLLGVGRKLRRARKPFLTTGEAEQAYGLVAEEFGDAPRAHTQFWKYLKELETADWLHLKKTGPSAEGQTQLVSLEDLPAAVLAEKIEGLLAGGSRKLGTLRGASP